MSPNQYNCGPYEWMSGKDSDAPFPVDSLLHVFDDMTFQIPSPAAMPIARCCYISSPLYPYAIMDSYLSGTISPT